MDRKLFFEYVHEFALDVVALMTGIASLVLAIIAAFQDKPVPRSAFWVSAGVCFVLASFRVWRTKHLALLLERQMNTADERQRKQLESRTTQAELAKIERENKHAAELKNLGRLDKRVLEYVKQTFDELTAQGARPASMAIVFTDEWSLNAARELGVEERAVKESLARLRKANKLNSLEW
jgi:hypothetical protein